MSATIYLHEFRTRMRSVITWSLSLLVMIFIFFSIFPAFSSQAAAINDALSKFPPALLAAFGMGQIDLSTVLGFYSFVFMFAQVCLAIQAGNYGFGLVSIEETELTADFLVSKPVSRVQIMNSKLLAAFTSLTITNVVVWAGTFAAIHAFKGSQTYPLGTLVLLLASIVIFQLFFLGVGLVISLLVRRVRSVTPYSLGLGFGMYILSAFSGLEGVSNLELITAFKHFDPNYIIQHAAYDTPLVLLNVGVTVVCLVASYWL
ncbi:MAG: ABC transporter permease subunit, partial [Acidobacteriaceae bacterium]